ncbi:MAG: HDOD domain-containing protein [Planctomycetaceae bacterium]|nr:HDOD domain-containing protein [Planctomycetaceae bacterium]
MIRQLPPLPTLPSVVLRAAELIKGRDISARLTNSDPLTRLIASDVALSTTLLRRANDEFGRAETPEQAVLAVPAGYVYSAVLKAPMIANGSAAAMDCKAFWTHSLAVACAGRLLAEQTAAVGAELAFSCGLLQDVGQLVLWQSMPKSYQRVLEAAAEGRDGDIRQCEHQILGIDHPTVGRRLAEYWGFSRSVQDSIWLSHQPAGGVPQQVGDFRLITLLALADSLAHEMGYSMLAHSRGPWLVEERADAAGISRDVLDRVRKALPEQVARRLEMLGLNGSGNPDIGMPGLSSAALSRANAELGRLNDILLQRLEQTTVRADAFDQARRISDALRGGAALGDVLVAVAEAMGWACQQPPSAASPVVAYSLDRSGDEMLAVCCDGSPRWRWQTVAAGAWLAAMSPAGQVPQALQIPGMSAVDVQGLDEWIDTARYVHYPLLCRGALAGGVLVRAPESPDPLVGATAALTAEALTDSLVLVQGRERAVQINEEFARCGQAVAAHRDAAAQAKALAAVGEMAGGAAHEMNNPLAIVSGRAQLMRSAADTDEQRQTWQLIADQAQRISDIISSLMEYARPEPPQPQAIDVRVLAAEAVSEFSSRRAQAAPPTVDIQVGDDVPAALADRQQIVKVLVELIANAATALGDAGGTITLSGRLDEIRDAVVLSVADSGPGMDDATLQHVFTPFFSLQAAGRRRGLGLPLARRYVENNRGQIFIRSRKGQGTVVYVQLPRAGQANDGNGDTTQNSAGGG